MGISASYKVSFLNNDIVDRNELNRMIELHKLWLGKKADGKRADFSNMNLSKMDLSDLDLTGAILNRVNLCEADLSGTNLTDVSLNGAYLDRADLRNTRLDRTNFCTSSMCNAKFDGCEGVETSFIGTCAWDCSFQAVKLKKAMFCLSEICDCNFSGSDLEDSEFDNSDFDNAMFTDVNLRNVKMNMAYRVYWSDFTGADMTGLTAKGVDFSEDGIRGAKGLYIPMCCPEEGAFVAWKKCRDEKIVKLLIPEDSTRSGSLITSMRCSKALVLEVYDENDEPCNEALSIIDDEFKYVKGQIVEAKEFDPRYKDYVTGIYFFLSKDDAKRYSED